MLTFDVLEGVISMKRKILLITLMTFLLSLVRVVEAAKVAVVLDVPTSLWNNKEALASVDKSAFKAKLPVGSVFQTAAEGVSEALKYRINQYNAEIDVYRHNGLAGYKNEFSVNDLKVIAEAQKCEYVMFIKTYGDFQYVVKDETVKQLYVIKQKVKQRKTELNLFFNCRVFEVKSNSFIQQDKFKITSYYYTVTSNKAALDKLYLDAFKKGMKTLGLEKK